jgi:hypothetical protein
MRPSVGVRRFAERQGQRPDELFVFDTSGVGGIRVNALDSTDDGNYLDLLLRDHGDRGAAVDTSETGESAGDRRDSGAIRSQRHPEALLL